MDLVIRNHRRRNPWHRKQKVCWTQRGGGCNETHKNNACNSFNQKMILYINISYTTHTNSMQIIQHMLEGTKDNISISFCTFFAHICTNIGVPNFERHTPILQWLSQWQPGDRWDDCCWERSTLAIEHETYKEIDDSKNIDGEQANHNTCANQYRE